MQNSEIVFYKPNDDEHFMIKEITPSDSDFIIREKYENALKILALEQKDPASSNVALEI